MTQIEIPRRRNARFRIAQKVLQRLEHQRTEALASWIGALQKLTFKQHDKKTLCQASLDLTTCETEVLTWIAQGKTNYEIGVILSACTGTICKYVERILSKLCVENRTAAAAIALATLANAKQMSDPLR
jgi:DNA-binding NarL/FixJ family response regulator